jgi:hypothetical protein
MAALGHITLFVAAVAIGRRVSPGAMLVEWASDVAKRSARRANRQRA